MRGTQSATYDLLERAGELETLNGLLDACRTGAGRVAVVEGPAGIGKSSLLDACAAGARERGIVVLRVRGDDMVMESSFAAVRELLWPQVQARAGMAFDGAARLAAPVFDVEAGARTDRDRVSTVLHGLYWLVSDAARETPLVLLVDDAQWLDPASSRFLLYLARRIDSLPVLLAIALRADEAREPQRLGPELETLADAVLRIGPLSSDGSGQVVRGVLGPRADAELCRSCHEVTRGNPFYLRELALALKAEGGRPTVELARRLRGVGVTAISRRVLLRLARLGPDCDGLAQALAVLGPSATLRGAASLAGLEREQAVVAVDRLHAADLLSAGRELAFVHPIVHEAIASQLPPARRAALHAQAARMLAADGASPDRVAAHLLSAQPYGDAWIVDALRVAARGAVARGAPEAAVSYLRRALTEPPRPDARLEVLLELGRAEAMLPVTHDFAALREALALAEDPRERAEIAFELALALFGVFRNADAVAVIEDALQTESELEPDLVARLDQARIGGGIGDLDASPRLIARAQQYFDAAARGEIDDPRMLATLSDTAVLAGMPVGVGVRLATAALADERLLHEWLEDGYVTATLALCEADRVEEAATALEAGIAEAQRRGSAPMLLQLTMIRTETALRAGDVGLAEECSERTLELARELGAELVGVLWRPIVLLERARPREAAAVFESLELDNATDPFEAMLVAHRGRVRVACGEFEAGVSDLLALDRRMRAAGLATSALVLDWAPAAGLGLAALGRPDEARELAARELSEATTFGSPRRHGVALSLYGVLDAGREGLDRLREAVVVLERSSAQLEHARALVNLGAGLFARGERIAAREPLSQGLDLAHRCGSAALADRAWSALVTTGARPRRVALTGPEALTAAERRTARMAADGLGNREIAQALFVSTKTVETQLSRAYEKLGIRGRADLPAALSVARLE
ncbi:MAG TPA: AAA family ATPase [Solirubrobacteraceae bacterium]|nr:AAA family ATPase [Solirubrobacteraceae bacterium]